MQNNASATYPPGPLSYQKMGCERADTPEMALSMREEALESNLHSSLSDYTRRCLSVCRRCF